MSNKKHINYSSWKSMHQRCVTKRPKTYKYYGAKGISVCEEWKDFKKFTEDMGPKPNKDYSIDRIDNSKGYFKENCRWATKLEQVLNRSTAVQCKNGHKWTNETTVLTNKGKARRCKLCTNRYMKNFMRDDHTFRNIKKEHALYIYKNYKRISHHKSNARAIAKKLNLTRQMVTSIYSGKYWSKLHAEHFKKVKEK